MPASDSESFAVNIAIMANILIFAAKSCVATSSGSSALLAEAVHSLADIGNQLLLRLGIARSRKPATPEYPYGFVKDKFVFSLISAVGVFCIGAGASIISGIYAIGDVDHDVDQFGLNFIVLAISFVVEGFSCAIAVNAVAEGARKSGLSFTEYLDSASDPAAVAVMAEDGAAVVGVMIAAASTLLVKWTDWQAWDGVGSIMVGALLAFVALFLIQRNRAVLIGRSMKEEHLALVLEYLNSDPVVNNVYDARSEELGPGIYRFSAELDFNGKMIADKHLNTINARTLARKFYKTQNSRNSEDIAAFSDVLSGYGAMLVRAVGSEVDRIEADIQELVPGVIYVDLEADRGRFWWYRASRDSDSDSDGFYDSTQMSLDATGWLREGSTIDLLLSESDNSESGGSGSGENDSDNPDSGEEVPLEQDMNGNGSCSRGEINNGAGNGAILKRSEEVSENNSVVKQGDEDGMQQRGGIRGDRRQMEDGEFDGESERRSARAASHQSWLVDRSKELPREAAAIR
jgi:solute carrier family 30 (zinc transporter), member 9